MAKKKTNNQSNELNNQEIIDFMKMLGYNIYQDLNGFYFLKDPKIVVKSKFRLHEIVDKLNKNGR